MKAGKPKTYHITRTMLTAMSELYAYIFCMLVSRTLVGMPIFGGALFMCARAGLAFMATFAGQTAAYLPPKARSWRGVRRKLWRSKERPGDSPIPWRCRGSCGRER